MEVYLLRTGRSVHCPLIAHRIYTVERPRYNLLPAAYNDRYLAPGRLDMTSNLLVNIWSFYVLVHRALSDKPSCDDFSQLAMAISASPASSLGVAVVGFSTEIDSLVGGYLFCSSDALVRPATALVMATCSRTLMPFSCAT